MEVEVTRGYHDLGGLPATAVDRSEHDYALWEKRVDALLMLLAKHNPPLVRIDEMRRGVESLGAEAYEQLSYYERWIAAITNVLLEKGIITVDELGRKMSELEAHFKVKS